MIICCGYSEHQSLNLFILRDIYGEELVIPIPVDISVGLLDLLQFKRSFVKVSIIGAHGERVHILAILLYEHGEEHSEEHLGYVEKY